MHRSGQLQANKCICGQKVALNDQVYQFWPEVKVQTSVRAEVRLWEDNKLAKLM